MNQSCPICGLENISDDKAECPQCDADLSCFNALDAIPDELPAPEAKVPRTGIVIATAVILLAMILIIGTTLFQFHRFKQFERLLADHRHSISNMDEELRRLRLAKAGTESSLSADTSPSSVASDPLVADTPYRVEGEGREAKALSPAPHPSPALADAVGQRAAGESPLGRSPAGNAGDGVSPPVDAQSVDSQLSVANSPLSPGDGQRTMGHGQPTADNGQPSTDNGQPSTDTIPYPYDFRIYVAEEDDTLWDISEAHYGSGHYYPVLLEHNPQTGIYSIGKGTQINILRDARGVRAIYHKITTSERGNLYWNYTTVEGDTVRSVISKFYKVSDIEKHMEVFNPDAPLQLGRKIRILLK